MNISLTLPKKGKGLDFMTMSLVIAPSPYIKSKSFISTILTRPRTDLLVSRKYFRYYFNSALLPFVATNLGHNRDSQPYHTCINLSTMNPIL